MSMKILRKIPELRGGGANSFVRRLFSAYTLSEIVIVMLIISVVVAVTIGITKRKLESTVSYTYYSAYETLKDVSRSLLTDFNPKNEKYQASLPNNLVNAALGNTPYENLLQTIWIQPANAVGLQEVTDGVLFEEGCHITSCPPGQKIQKAGTPDCYCDTDIDSPCPLLNRNCPKGFHLDNAHMADCHCVPDAPDSTTSNCDSNLAARCKKLGGIFNTVSCQCNLDLDPVEINPCLSKTCPEGYTKENVNGECVCREPQDTTCQRRCLSGYHLDVATCTCVPNDGGDEDPGTGGGDDDDDGDDPGTGSGDGSGDEPVAVCQPGDTPPECGQQCVDGQWQAIPGFSKDCAEYTEEWHDLPECKCMPVARTLPRTGENFCALFEERVNTNAGDCTGSAISSTTTDFSDKTPDLVLRNGIRIYNLHSDPVRLDELAGNKTGFTVSFDDNASASANTDMRIASNNTQYLAIQNEALNMFLRKPLSFFPLLSGLFELKAYALGPGFDTEIETEPDCDICHNIGPSDPRYEMCHVSCTPPFDGKPVIRTCLIENCLPGQHLVDGDTAFCKCVPDEPAGGGDGEEPDNGGDDTPPVTPDDNVQKVDTGEYGYIVYVDIDGERGSSTLWEDVYPFYITLSGQVVPAYRSSDGDNFGGNSDEYLQTSIQYEKINANGRRSITWLDKSVSFKEGACGSGYINSSTPYCAGVAEHAECSSNVSGSKCTLKTVKPVKFF